MPSDSPSQSVSSAISGRRSISIPTNPLRISGRRSTIALFIPGIPTNPLRIPGIPTNPLESTHSLQAYRVHEAASTTYTYSSHQFPSLFLHVKGQECPQTARRNQSHQQSVEGEVQLRFSSQAFQPIHSLSLFSSFSSLPCYWSTCNQYRSKSISFTKCKVLGFSTGFKNKEEGHQDTGPHVLFFFMRLWSYWCFLVAARGIRHSLEVRLFTLSILQNLHLGR